MHKHHLRRMAKNASLKILWLFFHITTTKIVNMRLILHQCHPISLLCFSHELLLNNTCYINFSVKIQTKITLTRLRDILTISFQTCRSK